MNNTIKTLYFERPDTTPMSTHGPIIFYLGSACFAFFCLSELICRMSISLLVQYIDILICVCFVRSSSCTPGYVYVCTAHIQYCDGDVIWRCKGFRAGWKDRRPKSTKVSNHPWTNQGVIHRSIHFFHIEHGQHEG